jgi:AcrR family transcriptional regulator
MVMSMTVPDRIYKSNEIVSFSIPSVAGSVSGMAIPTEAPGTKGDRTRQRLLEIAVRRFAADGFRRTSVSDIARDADLTPAAVYAYFTGKDALFQAAVDADASALIETSRAAVAGLPMREGVGTMVSVLGERVADHPLAARVLSGQEPEVIDRLLDLPSLRRLTDEVAAGIALAQEAGEIRADVDARIVAEGLESIVLSLLMSALQAGVTPSSRRATAARAVLDAALRPPEEGRPGAARLDRSGDRPQDARDASSGGPPGPDGGGRRRGPDAGVR